MLLLTKWALSKEWAAGGSKSAQRSTTSGLGLEHSLAARSKGPSGKLFADLSAQDSLVLKKTSGVNNRSHFWSFLPAALTLPSPWKGHGWRRKSSYTLEVNHTAYKLSALNQMLVYVPLQTTQFPLQMPVSSKIILMYNYVLTWTQIPITCCTTKKASFCT